MGHHDDSERDMARQGSTGTESGSDWGKAGGSGMGDTVGSTGTESGSDWGNAGGSGMGDQRGYSTDVEESELGGPEPADERGLDTGM
jgi:hypothetical protein